LFQDSTLVRNNHQQRIPLSRLSIYANPAGIKEFTWEPYLSRQSKPTTTGDWISQFEQDYFTRRGRTPKAQTTWETDYLAVFKRLPAHACLISDLLEQVVRATPRYPYPLPLGASVAKARQLCRMNAEPQALAGQLFPSVSGGTDTDTEITYWREQIHHPQWR
jgi:hypothetical protein